jgi:hypothetical protein
MPQGGPEIRLRQRAAICHASLEISKLAFIDL